MLHLVDVYIIYINDARSSKYHICSKFYADEISVVSQRTVLSKMLPVLKFSSPYAYCLGKRCFTVATYKDENLCEPLIM